MSNKLKTVLILSHWVILIVIGFFLYNSPQAFYLGVNAATILIYILVYNGETFLTKRNKILLQGLLIMTIVETLDYAWFLPGYDPFDAAHAALRLKRDAIIVTAITLYTTVRYFAHGKDNP